MNARMQVTQGMRTTVANLESATLGVCIILFKANGSASRERRETPNTHWACAGEWGVTR